MTGGEFLVSGGTNWEGEGEVSGCGDERLEERRESAVGWCWGVDEMVGVRERKIGGWSAISCHADPNLVILKPRSL
ncbi:hypothetical protein [Bartonella sp. MM73XJBT.G]|uniref:hypothetical protein n=1 Tax=Bartonella sp. MM73XJBT.G TaxID=3019097 RepID=UPI00235DFC5C|nr:hypothetical protein [Bartonella sp. MM73XJBT.G]